MTFDWNNFLSAATALESEARTTQNSGLREAKLRSAISRAYYSAFQISKKFLTDKLPTMTWSGDGRDHFLVKDAFKDNDDRNWQKIGTDLERLKSNRTLADYKDTVPGVENLAQISINYAQRIISGLDRLAP